MLRIWLAKDPETNRVTAQAAEWSDGDFPRGVRGQGWPRRQTDVPTQTWTKMLRATFSTEQQDRFHRQWWSTSAPEGVGPWPE